MNLMQAFVEKQKKANVPNVAIGDTVKVHLKVKEGNRERIQVFEGTVIAKKHGGIEETFTVRRVSYGVGVEKVFPVYSPSIEKIEVVMGGGKSKGLYVVDYKENGDEIYEMEQDDGPLFVHLKITEKKA